MHRVRVLTMVVTVLCGWSAQALAQSANWVESVFPERAYDFGTVARGSKVRHSFRVVNNTNSEIQIADYRTKCGCTEVKLGARTIPPGAQTTVEAVVDTTRFQGYKPSGLTLVISKPAFAEVDLNLSCFIRGDVWLDPGFVDFGTINRGAEPTVTLNLNYNGGVPNWGIQRMVTQNAGVSAKLTEIARSGNHNVQYQLVAKLDPKHFNGPFKDEITLTTNDPNTPTIPVSVVGNVLSTVSVSPSIVNLGRIKAGSTVKKTVLVRSTQPFQITEINGKSDTVAVQVDQSASRAVHPVAVTVTAPSKPGPYSAVLEIATNLKDEPPAKFTTFATIEP